MDKADKQDILNAITQLGASMRHELGGIMTDVAELKAGQARLEADVADLKADVADVKAGQARVSADIKQSQQAIAENYFHTGGRIDQVASMLAEHMVAGHKPAA